MTLGWYDRCNPRMIYMLPKREDKQPLFPKRGAEYAREFFQQIRGLGRIGIVTIRGKRTTRRAIRGW